MPKKSKKAPTAEALRVAHVEAASEPHEVPADPKLIARLDALAARVNKSFGKGTALRVDPQAEKDLSAGGISTGFVEIDDMLTGQSDKDFDVIPGTGIGLPRGRIIEIFGPESSGKTTLVYMLIADVQKKGGTAAYVDMEHALDTAYAESLGVDLKTLLVSQPDTAEQALDLMELFVREGIDLVALDSVAALTPEKEVKGEMGDSHMGVQARLMSQACRKLNSLLKPGGPTVIFINQLRQKLGVMWGNPETTTGGNALKFYASIRLDLRRIKTLLKTKDGLKKAYGARTRLKSIKNKCAPPFREVVFDILYGKGIRIPTAAQIKKDREESKAEWEKSKGKK